MRRFLNGLFLNSQRIQKLGAPTASDDAATKGYADALLGYKQIATTGDLSANPVAAITFSNLGVYSDVIFDFAGVGHDQSTGQSFSAAFSLDGSTFVSPVVISPSISTASAIHGEANIAPSLTGRPLMRCGLGSGSIQSAQWTNATENPRVAIAGSPILAMRFTPSTAGNFNKGVVTAYGR